MRVLVVYASEREGPPRSPAGSVSRCVRLGWTSAATRPGEAASLDGCDAAGVGGTPYEGRWHREARRSSATTPVPWPTGQ
ncbi:hypothetical protein [Actinomadura madurae]|uniref:hypothetical protein n=1 Tax=Actinomadura madurae TaxID=1993 RepID=UPI0011BE9EC0|nr:hypothetical protein [Actinomadura madurae]